MRVTITLGAFLFSMLGVTMMSATAVQDEQKRKTENTEKVTLRVWIEKQKTFIKPVENLGAYRKKMAGKDVIVIADKRAVGVGGRPTIGSEITDKDGKVYVVDKVVGKNPFDCYITEKPEKKD